MVDALTGAGIGHFGSQHHRLERADINGTATEYPIDIPLGGMSEVPLAVTCEGDTMTTKAAEQPVLDDRHRHPLRPGRRAR